MKEVVLNNNNIGRGYTLNPSTDALITITAPFAISNDVNAPPSYSIEGDKKIRLSNGQKITLELNPLNKQWIVTNVNFTRNLQGTKTADFISNFVPAVYAAMISGITAGTNTALANGQSLKTILQNYQAQINAIISGAGLVKVTSADTTPGYLDAKIAAGTGLDKTTLNPAANEQLELKLEDTAVTPGTYGSATQSPVIAFDQQGRATSASNTTITPAASDITNGQALTKTDDTNVTLTLGGTPGTALLKATSLTLGWTGTLAETRGGTGQGTYTQGDILYASGANTLTKLGAGSSGQLLKSGGAGANVSWANYDDFVAACQALGSDIKAQTVGINFRNINTAGALGDQTLLLNAVYIPVAQTITGVMWYQTVQGSYTANNYNGIGLYSYNAGSLTLVASSTNDGNIWKAASNTYGTKAFSSTYAAVPGIYFVGVLYCRSAQVTAPQIGLATSVSNVAVNALNFTNSAKFYGTVAALTAFPSPQLMSGVTGQVANVWHGLY